MIGDLNFLISVALVLFASILGICCYHVMRVPSCKLASQNTRNSKSESILSIVVSVWGNRFKETNMHKTATKKGIKDDIQPPLTKIPSRYRDLDRLALHTS